MAERARISRHYHIRIFLIALACLGLGAWFMQDGYIKYPKMQRTYQRFEALKEQYPTDYQQRWYEIARTEGLPEKPEAKSDADIVTQKIIGYLLVPFGLFVLARFLLNLRRWVEMDESGLRDQSGRDVKWADIKELDKTRWDRKGIAVVRYAQAGREGKIVLDDWKYDRDPIVAMVKRIDAELGNPPESPESTESPESAQPDSQPV